MKLKKLYHPEDVAKLTAEREAHKGRVLDARRALTDMCMFDEAQVETFNPPFVSRANNRVVGVAVVDAGKPKWHPAADLVFNGIQQGWLQDKGEVLELLSTEDDNTQQSFTYRILRRPGYYCCHCGVSLPGANERLTPTLTAGLKHVADVHGGAQSPDPNNPSGYERLNYFDCERVV